MHNKPPIRALLFDYGGVIAEEGFANGLEALAEEQALKTDNMTAEGMQAVYDSGFVLGRGTSADFWALLRQRTGLQGDDRSLTDRILSGFVLRQWMIELVQKLRSKDYITAILSDQTYWLDELDQRDHFYQAFDHIYNSYYLGKGKQDPALFTDIAGNLGLAAENILFIDDNKNNTARAESMGMRCIHYTDRATFIKRLETLLENN